MNTVTYLGVFAALGMLIFPDICANSARQSLILCAKAVIPSLFPYFICINLILKGGLAEKIGKRTGFLMRPVFNVPGEGAFVFIAGLLSGYPSGAKCAAELLENGTCTKSEAQRMVNFCNNSGPIFILGSVGSSMLGNHTAGAILLAVHVLSAVTLGIILGRNAKTETAVISAKRRAAAPSLSAAVTDAVNLILYVCGYIVFFNILVSLLCAMGVFNPLCRIFTKFGASPEGANAFLCGLIEMTGGISRLSAINTALPKLLLVSALLGFGGISVIMQIYGIISKYGLSLKSFICAKLMQSAISVVYTALFSLLPISITTGTASFSVRGTLVTCIFITFISLLFIYVACCIIRLLQSCIKHDIIN